MFQQRIFFQTQNATLLDQIEDLESRSRGANLRIINVPEDSEGNMDPVAFVSDMPMEITGDKVFNRAPALERLHRVGKKLCRGGLPFPFVVCLQQFQEKERMLRWARQHELRQRLHALPCLPPCFFWRRNPQIQHAR